jgi:hypothetical protein
MVSFREALWFTFYHLAEVVDSAAKAWKTRSAERRAKEKRRRFNERRSGWDRRARVATVPAYDPWPVAWLAAARSPACR